MNATKDQAADIAVLMRDGFGVEDVAVLLALPPKTVRRKVARWRELHQLPRVLDIQDLNHWIRNDHALRTMGVTHD